MKRVLALLIMIFMLCAFVVSAVGCDSILGMLGGSDGAGEGNPPEGTPPVQNPPEGDPPADSDEPEATYNYSAIIREIAYAFDRCGGRIQYDQLNSRRSM